MTVTVSFPLPVVFATLAVRVEVLDVGGVEKSISDVDSEAVGNGNAVRGFTVVIVGLNKVTVGLVVVSNPFTAAMVRRSVVEAAVPEKN